MARIHWLEMGPDQTGDQLQGLRAGDPSRVRARNGMGVSEMQDAEPAHGLLRDHRCHSLVADIARSCNHHARIAARERGLATGLDAAAAPVRDSHRQEQAPGPAGLSGSLAAGEEASIDTDHCQGLSKFRESFSHSKGGASLSADGACHRERHRGDGSRRRSHRAQPRLEDVMERAWCHGEPRRRSFPRCHAKHFRALVRDMADRTGHQKLCVASQQDGAAK